MTQWKFESLIGRKFERLTVLEIYGKNKANNYIWKCQCDCGNITKATTAKLKGGHIKSCGCARRLSDRNYVIEKKLFVRFKATAKKKGHKVLLSLDEFKEQVRQNCFYCGVEPSNVYIYEWTGEKYKYSGLDRVDSSRDYEPGNIVPCCKSCNVAKSEMSTSDFITWISRVYKHFVVWNKF